MLSTLKRELKQLIGEDRADKLFDRLLGEVLRTESLLYNLTTQLKAQLRKLGRASAMGTVSVEQGNLNFNSINEGLFHVIDQLGPDDLSDDLRVRADTFLNVPPFHAYSVDRVAQVEQFEMERFFSDDPDCKIHFYYLHGDVRQEAHTFIERMGLELGGRTLSAAGLEQEFAGKRPIMAYCKPEPRGNKKLFEILLIKALLEQFIGPVNNMRDLATKSLSDLLPSPKFGGLEPGDPVCITVSLDHHNWNKAIVPAVLRELFEKFCGCELPPEAPTFYFYFGLEYSADRPDVRDEVKAALAEKQYGSVLEELLPVTAADVAEWFSRHRPLLPPGQEPEQVVAKYFPGDGPFDMIDVEKTLLKLIDAHNKGLALTSA